ncbi:MAG: hypothetical protein EOP45_14430 [Sphingobacteriaceae bacterium]|nr:MAG: hypothetical protein EOP45_14430 [Sphingobacteriaceae bacterium]
MYSLEVLHVNSSSLEENSYTLVDNPIEHYKKYGVKGIVDEEYEGPVAEEDLPDVAYRCFTLNNEDDKNQMEELCGWLYDGAWRSKQAIYTQCTEGPI